jgi:hypothetical protein
MADTPNAPPSTTDSSGKPGIALDPLILAAIKRSIDSKTTSPATTTKRELTPNRLHDYGNGEQWREGKYWRGRKPKNAGSEGVNAYGEIMNLFIQDDQIGTSIDRFVASTIAKDPEFSTTLQAADELELTQFWKDQKVHDKLNKLVRDGLVDGISSITPYLPDKFAPDGIPPRAKDLKEALAFIRVNQANTLQSGRIKDPHDDVVASYYATTIENLKTGKKTLRVEVQTPTVSQSFELVGAKMTALNEAIPNEFVKVLTAFYERPSGSILRWQHIDLQDRLNVAWTNLSRNDDLAGFRMLSVSNAKRPTDPLTGLEVNWHMGADVVLMPEGLEIEGGGLTTPNVLVIDPINVSTVNLPTITAFREAIAGHFNQTWAKTNTFAMSEGSQKETRKGFDKTVMGEGALLNLVVETLVKNTLLLAGALQGDALKYADIAVTPRIFMDVAQGDLEIFKALSGAPAGLVSIETIIESNPAVTDPLLELKRLKKEQITQQQNQPTTTPPKTDPTKIDPSAKI